MAKQTEIYVLIDDGINRYYLLKVVRRGFDVYCFPPYIGIHFSVHASGISHFTYEEAPGQNGDQIPVVLMSGEAGTVICKDIVRGPLSNEGRASGICTAIYPIESLADDFPTFERNRKHMFVIDVGSLPVNTTSLIVGVWGVPDRNKDMFRYNNPEVREDLIYKPPGDPPIWIYARPA